MFDGSVNGWGIASSCFQLCPEWPNDYDYRRTSSSLKLIFVQKSFAFMDDLCEFNVSEIPEPVCLFVWSLPVHLPYWPAACLLRRFSVEMHHVCVCRLLSWPWVIHSTSDQWPWATFLLNSARLGDKARNVLVSYNSLRASPVASHCQGNLAFFLYSTAATKQPAIWVFLPKWP